MEILKAQNNQQNPEENNFRVMTFPDIKNYCKYKIINTVQNGKRQKNRLREQNKEHKFSATHNIEQTLTNISKSSLKKEQKKIENRNVSLFNK